VKVRLPELRLYIKMKSCVIFTLSKSVCISSILESASVLLVFMRSLNNVDNNKNIMAGSAPTCRLVRVSHFRKKYMDFLNLALEISKAATLADTCLKILLPY
jgi:hypothetical protein